MGTKAAARYARLIIVMVIPHPRTARLGRRSTFTGHSGSSHTGSDFESEYARRELAAQATTATEAPRAIAVTAMRIQCNHLENLWYLAEARSSVVKAGGPMLGLRPCVEKVGEVWEVIWGFCPAEGSIIRKDVFGAGRTPTRREEREIEGGLFPEDSRGSYIIKASAGQPLSSI